MLRAILDWLGGGVVKQFTDPLLQAYKARLSAQNSTEKLEAEQGEDERVLGKLAPQDLFARYYRAQHGVEPTPELLALFADDPLPVVLVGDVNSSADGSTSATYANVLDAG